ncbi:hypothetical protein C6P45_003013 [Maudiozyma exigua]|uniref:Uncharacterized protein n=1 Tax=Maudiozyma exigua TaxID=34358 RepID=A0A9P6WEM7_MAUEX|nr:hypothetical protein C6P45_003013 [Kazachstania exigua]
MSVWPFGSNSNSNNLNNISIINKKLNEYFNIINNLQSDDISINPNLLNFKDDNLNTIHENEPLTKSPSTTTIGSSSDNDNDEDEIHLKKQHTAKEQYTITDLDSTFIESILKDSELLNELNRQNNKLLNFLCYGIFYNDTTKKQIQNFDYLVDQLLSCCDSIDPDCEETTRIPSDNISQKENNIDSNQEKEDENEEDSENNKLLQRATIISEIFASDIWIITDNLMKDISCLNKIWSLIKHPNFNSEKSILVSIYIKINQNLLFSKQDDYLKFILTHLTLVDDMLKHIDISMVMDFLLKLIGSDRIDCPTGIIQFLSKQDLIPKLLRFLNNDTYGPDIQAYVGDFLKAIIAISANAPLDDVSVGPNDLTRKLASPDTIDTLTSIMIRERGAALNIAVSVVIELIRKNNSDYDQINLLATTLRDNPPTNRDPIYLGYLLKKFTTCLPSLFQIILDIEFDKDVPTRKNQLGEIFKPLGFERFKIVELIAELLHCSNMGLMNSKRAERIATKRDLYRQMFLTNDDNQTVPTLHRLSINESSIGYNENNDDAIIRNENDNVINNENKSKQPLNENKDEIDNALEKFLQENDGDDGDEVDESFDIPYVKDTQNEKLRNVPTIGDFYKISLYDNYIIPTILLLFLKYPWNNFWHNVIFDIIQQIFNGRMDFSYNSFLVYSLFDIKGSYQFNKLIPTKSQDPELDISNFKITTDFILRGYQSSYKFYDAKNMNLGYMGHLVLIAEEVVKFSKLYKVELISPDIFQCLQDEYWQYYSEEVLNDTRMMYSKILGGGTYVEDGNGNIIPQLPDTTYNTDSKESGENDNDNGINGEENMGGGLVNVESLEEQLSTESDLHYKLKQMLISKSRTDVDEANEKKGVIILGPPPSSS